jgi:hypothetical protein
MCSVVSPDSRYSSCPITSEDVIVVAAAAAAVVAVAVRIVVMHDSCVCTKLIE